MLKSQYESTDICSESSSEGGQILLRIEGIGQQYTLLFLNGDASDFRIYHRGASYPLHRAVIFKYVNLHVLDDEANEGCLHAPDSLNSQVLLGVLSCLYGLELRICRSEALEALEAIHFLKVAKLKKQLEDDMISNFEEYDLFPLLEKARAMAMPQVEDECMRHLQLEGYEQMRYAKYELLSCSEGTFKFVVHSHNEQRWEDPCFGQSDRFVQDLVQEYCRHNAYNQRKKTLLLKSFNEMSVKSDIPLAISDPRVNSEGSNEVSIRVCTPRASHTESMISPTKYFSAIKPESGSSRSMIMDLTFMSQKRKKSNRGSENNSSQSKNCIDCLLLKDSCRKQEKAIEELKDSIEKLTGSLTQKETEAQNNKFRLSEIENMLEECERNMMENNRHARVMEVRFNKIEERRGRQRKSSKEEDEQEEEEEEEKKEESSEEDEKEKEKGKTENPKDQKLHVSLVKSRWLCC